MARARDPNRDRAKDIWNEHGGNITNRLIADQLGIDEKKVAVWKQRDKWNVVQQTSKTVVQQKQSRPEPAKKQRTSSGDFDNESIGKLSDKHKIFVEEYLVDLNGTQAAIRAGYSERTANEQASQLLAKLSIQAAIRVAKARREQRLHFTQDDVVNQLAKIAFADIKDVIDWDSGKLALRPSEEVDGTILSEISETVSEHGRSKKVKLNDRMRALLKLYEHMSDEQRLRIDKLRSDAEAKKAEEDNDPHAQGAGYEEALNAHVKDVFADEDIDDEA
ncbi:terminase small subunit [Paenibacillus sinopodophylli]|uniref:terminase small subunit n=1 Tax=Paenibacillus sinopodophylli TaxID=1837342 RepID=UPI00110D051B|nr:terminase small subunit [Paenibacillus sinopodophylli]